MPKVSIIVPCFNQAEFLSETLESVLAQTYSDWECIIMNDGSTDNTESIALSFVNKDNRFKYYKQENQGLSATRNNAIKKSSGEYILPLDSDDKIGEEYIKIAVRMLDLNANIEVVYCRAELFGNKTGEWVLDDFSPNIVYQNCVFCSALFRKKTFDLVGGYSTNLKYGYEDWDFWLKILDYKRDSIFYKINQVLFYYRIRGNSMLRSITPEQNLFLYKTICNSHKNLYPYRYILKVNILYLIKYKIFKCFRYK